jgi:hypothetical protein
MAVMRRFLVACMALHLGCNPAQPGSDQGSGKATPAKAPEAKTPAKPNIDAKVDTKVEPDAKAPKPQAPPVEPAPATIPLPAATTELLDRLVPTTERVAVTEAAAKALEIRSTDAMLWVVDGSRRAALNRRGDTVHGVTIVNDASGEPVLRIDYEDDVFCGDTRQHADVSARSLLARLEHVSGQEHQAKGDLEAAARGFARAAQLDSSLDDAWTSLARALAKQSDTASAMAALDPLIRRAPLQTYHQVLSDPALASLREQPAITALRAPKPGKVELRKLPIAYSAHHSLVALLRTEQSWGACNYVQELRLHSTTTGEMVLNVPLAGYGDTDPDCDSGGKRKVLPDHRTEVNGRFATAERLLRDMGFSVSPGLELVDPSKVPGEDSVMKAQLPGVGVEIEIDEEKVVVRKGSAVLVDRPQTLASNIVRAGYDPAAHVAFIEWYGQVPEGCAFDEDGQGYYVFPIPASP